MRLQAMRNWIAEYFELIAAATAIVLVIGIILKYVVAPLAPVFTVFFVAVGTAMSWRYRLTGLLTLYGAIFYLVSWPAMWVGFPSWIVIMFSGGGVVMWLIGFIWSFQSSRVIHL